MAAEYPEQYWEEKIFRSIKACWKEDPYRLNQSNTVVAEAKQKSFPPSYIAASVSLAEANRIGSILGKIYTKLDFQYFISLYGIVPANIWQTIETTQGNDIQQFVEKVARKGQATESAIGGVFNIYRQTTQLYLRDRTGISLATTLISWADALIASMNEPQPEVAKKLFIMGGERYIANFRTLQPPRRRFRKIR